LVNKRIQFNDKTWATPLLLSRLANKTRAMVEGQGKLLLQKAGQALQYAKLTHEQDRTFGTGGHLLQDITHSLNLAAIQTFASLAKICLAALLHI
jgi:hypothetical protein